MLYTGVLPKQVIPAVRQAIKAFIAQQKTHPLITKTSDLDQHYHDLCKKIPDMTEVFPITDIQRDGSITRPSTSAALNQLTSTCEKMVEERTVGMQRVISTVIKKQVRELTNPDKPSNPPTPPGLALRKRKNPLAAWLGTELPSPTPPKRTRTANPRANTQMGCTHMRCNIAVAQGKTRGGVDTPTQPCKACQIFQKAKKIATHMEDTLHTSKEAR